MRPTTVGGDAGNRTQDRGFADPRLTTWLRRPGASSAGPRISTAPRRGEFFRPGVALVIPHPRNTRLPSPLPAGALGATLDIPTQLLRHSRARGNPGAAQPETRWGARRTSDVRATYSEVPCRTVGPGVRHRRSAPAPPAASQPAAQLTRSRPKNGRTARRASALGNVPLTRRDARP